MRMRIFFAGEGSDELGEWAGHPAYHPRPGTAARGGVLHALARRFASSHNVVAGSEWKAVKKFRVGKHDAPETQTVLGLALRAEELGCDTLIFTRDRDGYEDREADVEAGIAAAAERFGVRIIGGTANEELEAWLLALLGDRKAEQRTDAKAFLERQHGIGDRDAKIRVVEDAHDAWEVPAQCASFKRWIERAAD